MFQNVDLYCPMLVLRAGLRAPHPPTVIVAAHNAARLLINEDLFCQQDAPTSKLIDYKNIFSTFPSPSPFRLF
ncbi:hypothetical protein E2C01_032374 [Portunus trituberculatus]|uniref:Uncharacterized protein n=1 Tax=Portunus trituberculatus TaxID=210409 RepID=A0A5B7F0S3_PORTR|nr:hypothetical protein [Portunus trituberculatus]